MREGKNHHSYRDEEGKNRARQIRELYSTGEYSRKEIAEIFDLHYSSICQIISRKIRTLI